MQPLDTRKNINLIFIDTNFFYLIILISKEG